MTEFNSDKENLLRIVKRKLKFYPADVVLSALQECLENLQGPIGVGQQMSTTIKGTMEEETPLGRSIFEFEEKWNSIKKGDE